MDIDIDMYRGIYTPWEEEPDRDTSSERFEWEEYQG